MQIPTGSNVLSKLRAREYSKYTSNIRIKDPERFVKAGASTKYETLVDYFVDEITSPFNQDVSLLIVGNKGRGKSRVGISLSYYAACELAQRMGGRWDDYFDPETHMAVINPRRASEVMAIKDKYAVKNFDDIGIGWGARRWQSTENVEKGEVFQINRIDSQLQIFSVPHQFLLDKIPRSLVSHYAEMDQQFFAYGFTTLKMFKPVTLFREGKIIQPYLSVNRMKYVLYRIPKPPEFLDKIYTRIRKAATEEAMKERLQDKARGSVNRVLPSLPVQPQRDMIRPLVWLEQHRADIERLVQEGNTKRQVFAWLRTQGINRDRCWYWWNGGFFQRLGFNVPP